MNIKLKNKYDHGLIFLIFLLAFGAIGGPLQPIRILGVVLLIPLILSLMKSENMRLLKLQFLCFLLFFIYAILSLIWTPSFLEGLKHLFYYVTHACIFFTIIIWSRKALNPFASIAIGWAVCILATLPIAYYEIITLSHLPISRLHERELINLSGIVEVYRFASVTFGNPNAYIVIMCFAFPFLLFGAFYIRSTKPQMIIFITILFAIPIFFVNSSRGGIVCLFIFIIFWLYYTLKYFGKSYRVLCLSFLLIVIVIFISPLFVDFINVYALRFFSRVTEVGSGSDNLFGRQNIYLDAWNLIKMSYFLGWGIGSENEVMLEFGNSGFDSSHNLFLELLIQFGIVGLTIMTLFLIEMFRKFFSSNLKYNGLVFSCFAVAAIPLFSINSGYLLMPSLWVLLSCVLVFVTGPSEMD